MANQIAICTGTISNGAGNMPVCSVPWTSGPYSYSPSIGDTMTISDVVELSWLVVACLAAAFIFKQLKRSA